MNSPVFLSWLKRGLASAVGEVDNGQDALALRNEIKPVLSLEDSRGVTQDVEKSFSLIGPAEVTGIDTSQVIRTVPVAGDSEVETNYFPFVEVLAPDLPWMLTPAQANRHNVLRPWLVLVCVEQREGVSFNAATVPLPQIQLRSDLIAAELPDLSESWAWVHVQSMVESSRVQEEVQKGSGSVIARLMCPRKLLPGRSYRAAVVPAFDVGRLAAMGEDVSGYTQCRQAWAHQGAQSDLVLPVYYTWTFSTHQEAADFETLARRLAPDTEGGRMGYHDCKVVNTGLLKEVELDTSFEYPGTLTDPGSKAKLLRRAATKWFQRGMRKILNETADRQIVESIPPNEYNPETDDPVFGPPLYGAWAANKFKVPPKGWLAELNLQPGMRCAAGLGARLIREHQDEFLAAAWDQAGDIKALQEELNRARLAAELGRSTARKWSALDDNKLFQVTARQHVFVNMGRTTAAERIKGSVIVPTGLTSSAFARQTRPGAIVSRRSAVKRHEPSVGVRAIEQFVAVSVQAGRRTVEQEQLANFGVSFVGPHTVTKNTSFKQVETDDIDIHGNPVINVTAVENKPLIQSGREDNVTGVTAAIRASLDPMTSIVAELNQRIKGVRLNPNLPVPTRVPVGPRFTDPLFDKLQAFGSQLVLPGVDNFSNNKVRLLAVNESWIATFLASCNHEWTREAL